MYTPLKKRRLARESLSCEQNTIVPVSNRTNAIYGHKKFSYHLGKLTSIYSQCIEENSPVLTSEDSPVKDDQLYRQYKMRNIMESIYTARDRTRSDSGQGSDDQCNMDNDVLNVSLKGPHDSENIRRIIGVPTPEEELPPEIPRPDDIKTNNNNLELEESNYNKVVPMEIDTTIPQPKIQETIESSVVDPKRIESPTEKLNSCQSADTSGNSSPQRDEMDDIQKKIHSFHTENIQILKSRNKKPKEKRKKVNLNFDLNMVDDQISIQLRTESDGDPEINGDVHDDNHEVSPENIPLPPVESIPLPSSSTENIPLPEEPSPMPLVLPPETIPLPEGPMTPTRTVRCPSPVQPPLRHVSPTQKHSPRLVSPRRISPKRVSPRRVSPRLVSPKRVSPRNVSPPTCRASPVRHACLSPPIHESPIRRPSPIRHASPVRILTPKRTSPVPEDKPERPVSDRPSVLDSSPVSFSTRFSATGLFSGIFNNMTQNFTDSSINENVPNMSLIKSAIERTTSLDSSLFDKDSITQSDEMKSVQEILTRVNNMDSNNSVILSGVLKSSNQDVLLPPSPKPAAKLYCARINDPRLNPPPVEKPKPIRRKVS